MNAFKWKGFISLDCVYGNIYSFRYAQRSQKLESVRLFNASLALALFALLRLHSALNIHYLQNQMHHVTPCYVEFLMFEFNFLVPISPAIHPVIFYSSFAAPILYAVYTCYALPTLFSSFNSSSHSNYAAPIPPKVGKHSNNHSTSVHIYQT